MRKCNLVEWYRQMEERGIDPKFPIGPVEQVVSKCDLLWKREEILLQLHLMPRYKHDCESCVYLGQHNEYDIYFCEQPMVNRPTVIARWSDEGRDYLSGMPTRPFLWKYPDHPRTEAWKRARCRGLI